MNPTALLNRLVPCACLAWGAFTLTAQDAAITYQGRLSSGPNAAHGTYDLWFSVHDAPTGGNQAGASLTNVATTVTGGLFVVDLDFGPGVFTGPPRWLEINVRTNGTEPFTTLSPRQRIAPTPYALYAHTAGTAATAFSANAVAAGAVGPSGLQDGAVDSLKITDGTISSADLSPSLRDGTFWKLGGNAATTVSVSFLGTTDNQPLDLKVNGQRALRLEPTAISPNLIGGFAGNYLGTGVVGGTIGGGGAVEKNNVIDEGVFEHFGELVHLVPDFSTVGGGAGNRIVAGKHATIAGGSSNAIVSYSPVFGSGDHNTIGGGANNGIRGAVASTIAGGERNGVRGGSDYGVGYSTIGGGLSNNIIGGTDPVSSATIAGGQGNSIEQFCDSSTIGGGAQNSVQFTSGGATIAGGRRNAVAAAADLASIGGGLSNLVVGRMSVIGGGAYNRGFGEHATIGGGQGNRVFASHGTIPGGSEANAASYGQLSYASGGFAGPGDAQTSVYVCRNTTTNATSTELRLDGALERMKIPDNATWSFDILVTGRTATGASAGYQIRGAIARNPGATAFVGSPSVTVLGEDVSSWSAGVVADDLNDTLAVVVTGAADTTIRWVASVRTVEVIF